MGKSNIEIKMGYTHYWYKVQEIPLELWKDFTEDFNKVLPLFVRYLSDTTDDNSDELIVDNDEIRFNGIGQNAHETFYFERTVDIKNKRFVQYRETNAVVQAQAMDTEPHIFNFCKTARKPYDIAVMCALVIACHHFKDKIMISSDGEINSEWREAVDMCKDRLGYGEDLVFDSEEDL